MRRKINIYIFIFFHFFSFCGLWLLFIWRKCKMQCVFWIKE